MAGLANGNWYPIRSERLPRARESGKPPAVALLDLAEFGRALGEMQTPTAQRWRKFLGVHFRKLQKEGGTAGVWLDAVARFQVFQLRHAVGLVEDGVTKRDLQLGSPLGKGSFGVVLLAKHVLDDAWFAVKTIKKPRRSVEDGEQGGERAAEMERRMELERAVLHKLSHESKVSGKRWSGLFVRLVCSWQDADSL